MDRVSYSISIIPPSPLAFTIAVASGTILGILKGIVNHECVDLRSGIRCGLRNAILSVTVSSIAYAIFTVLDLLFTAKQLVLFGAIEGFCLSICWLYGRELVNGYEHILNLFLDRLIFTSNAS